MSGCAHQPIQKNKKKKNTLNESQTDNNNKLNVICLSYFGCLKCFIFLLFKHFSIRYL